jgi:hypothetical protein
MSQKPIHTKYKKRKWRLSRRFHKPKKKKRKRIVSMPRRATWFYARNVMEGGWGRFQHEKKKIERGGADDVTKKN